MVVVVVVVVGDKQPGKRWRRDQDKAGAKWSGHLSLGCWMELVEFGGREGRAGRGFDPCGWV